MNRKGMGIKRGRGRRRRRSKRRIWRRVRRAARVSTPVRRSRALARDRDAQKKRRRDMIAMFLMALLYGGLCALHLYLFFDLAFRLNGPIKG